MSSKQATVYIVVLNWNGWTDTTECLESLFHLRDVSSAVIVCDNGSSDDSLARLRAWAGGELRARRTPFLADADACPKPLAFLELKATEIETRGRGDNRLVLIDNGSNLGFACGNNVGIAYALRHDDCAFVWVLNNDTVVDPLAARALVDTFLADPTIGMCGSQVRFYGKPGIIQSFGGTLNRWFCTTMNLYNGVPASAAATSPRRIDFIPGSSMMVSKAFTERVGLMADDYFLYFEEIDWAERGRGTFRLALSAESVVYHRGGSSIGSPREHGIGGIRSEYFLLHNRFVFAKKFFPWAAPVVAAGLVVSVVKRLIRGQWRRARIAVCALLGIVPEAIRQQGTRRPESR